MTTAGYEVVANERIYEVVDDVTTVVEAFAIGRAIDETTGERVVVPLRARLATPRNAAAARTTAAGGFGVTGIRDVAMPDPLTSYDFDLIIDADGFQRAAFTIVVPAGSTLPVALPDVTLRRTPVRMQGRVVQAVGGAPVAGARVELVDPSLPATARVISLRTPCAYAHAAGTPVRAATVTPGAATQTVEAAVAGDRSMVLQNRTGIGAGTVLRVGQARVHEYVEVLGPGAGAPTTLGRVWLQTRLRRSHDANTAVRQVVVATPAAPDALLLRPAVAGDSLLVANTAVGAAAVQLEDSGTPGVEHHATGAITDAQGYWSFGAVSGVRELRIQVLVGGAVVAPTPVPLVIDYGRKINVVDLRVA